MLPCIDVSFIHKQSDEKQTIRPGKCFTGEDRMKVLCWQKRLQFRTRAECSHVRVTLITGLLCLTFLHVVSLVSCMQSNQ